MLKRWLGSAVEGGDESKCCGNPDRGCGGREMEAINAVQETKLKSDKKHDGRKDPDGHKDLQTVRLPYNDWKV